MPVAGPWGLLAVGSWGGGGTGTPECAGTGGALGAAGGDRWDPRTQGALRAGVGDTGALGAGGRDRGVSGGALTVRGLQCDHRGSV